MDGIEIRRISLEGITEEQFSEIVDLEKNCGLDPFPPDVLALDIEYEETWAAFDGSRIAGFITVSSEEGYFSEDLFIFNINVGREWRNEGIASALIRKALTANPECLTMSLDVNLENTKALNLYRKLGFERTGTPSMNGITDIVMRGNREKILSPS